MVSLQPKLQLLFLIGLVSARGLYVYTQLHITKLLERYTFNSHEQLFIDQATQT